MTSNKRINSHAAVGVAQPGDAMIDAKLIDVQDNFVQDLVPGGSPSAVDVRTDPTTRKKIGQHRRHHYGASAR